MSPLHSFLQWARTSASVLINYSITILCYVISRMKLLPPGRELRLFYFSRPGSFLVNSIVVGSLFIYVSFLLERKKGRKGIRMLISGAEN